MPCYNNLTTQFFKRSGKLVPGMGPIKLQTKLKFLRQVQREQARLEKSQEPVPDVPTSLRLENQVAKAPRLKNRFLHLGAREVVYRRVGAIMRKAEKERQAYYLAYQHGLTAGVFQDFASRLIALCRGRAGADTPGQIEDGRVAVLGRQVQLGRQESGLRAIGGGFTPTTGGFSQTTGETGIVPVGGVGDHSGAIDVHRRGTSSSMASGTTNANTTTSLRPQLIQFAPFEGPRAPTKRDQKIFSNKVCSKKVRGGAKTSEMSVAGLGRRLAFFGRIGGVVANLKSRLGVGQRATGSAQRCV